MVCRSIVAGPRVFAVGGALWVFARLCYCALWFGFVRVVSLASFAFRGDGCISVFIVADRRHMFRCLRPVSARGGDPRLGASIVLVYEVGD